MSQRKQKHSGIRMAVPCMCMKALGVGSSLCYAGSFLKTVVVLVVVMMTQAHSDSVFPLSSALFEALVHLFHEVLLLPSIYR